MLTSPSASLACILLLLCVLLLVRLQLVEGSRLQLVETTFFVQPLRRKAIALDNARAPAQPSLHAVFNTRKQFKQYLNRRFAETLRRRKFARKAEQRFKLRTWLSGRNDLHVSKTKGVLVLKALPASAEAAGSSCSPQASLVQTQDPLPLSEAIKLVRKHSGGASLGKCREALLQTENNDISAALQWLERTGFAHSVDFHRPFVGKLEGLVGVVTTAENDEPPSPPHGCAATILEVNCQTDFAAVNHLFRQLSQQLLSQAAAQRNCWTAFVEQNEKPEDVQRLLGKETATLCEQDGASISSSSRHAFFAVEQINSEGLTQPPMSAPLLRTSQLLGEQIKIGGGWRIWCSGTSTAAAAAERQTEFQEKRIPLNGAVGTSAAITEGLSGFVRSEQQTGDLRYPQPAQCIPIIASYVHGSRNSFQQTEREQAAASTECTRQLGVGGAVVALTAWNADQAEERRQEREAMLMKKGRQLAMHILCAKPLGLSIFRIPKGCLQAEAARLRSNATQDGNNLQHIVEKIVQGKLMKKFVRRRVLLEQEWMLDTSKRTVKEVLRDWRAELGFDIRVDDFKYLSIEPS